MYHRFRSHLAFREFRRTRTPDEIRDWIQDVFEQAERETDEALFFAFDARTSTVRVLDAYHRHPERIEAHLSAIRIRSWDDFRNIFNACARSYVASSPRDGYPLELHANARREDGRIGFVFHRSGWLERLVCGTVATTHDCEAGCCGCDG